MKKYILPLLFFAAAWAEAQNYVVTSVATPGAATFSSNKIDNGVITLPFAATTDTLHVQTNQQPTVSSSEEWCEASFADGILTLTASENQGNDARTATITVRSKDFHPLALTVRQEARLVFGVISDTHIGNNVGEGPMKKVPQALQNLTRHGKLDALAVVGDLTDHGDTNQYTDFVSVFNSPDNILNPVDKFLFMMGNHDNYNSSGQANYANGLKKFNRNISYPLHQYKLIKGYPFIAVSVLAGANNDNNESDGIKAYPDQTISTLKNYLNRAKRDAPGKPIFIFAHVAPRNTCYSTWGDLEGAAWAMWRLNKVLKGYPQAVVFCGHSHYPLGDPRSIHQGANPDSKNMNYYTVINTASTTYSEINPNVVEGQSNGIHPKGYEYVTEGLILEEQANGDIEIRRYDTYRDVEIDPNNRWVLRAPFDGSMFQYADIRDKDDNPNNVPLRDGLPAPAFTKSAVLTAEAYPEEVTLTFPQATDNECVFRYEVRLLKDGREVRKASIFSRFYLTVDMPRRLSYTFDGLSKNTKYQAEVTAFDSWDNASVPLSTTFMTPATENPTPEPLGCWTFDNPDDLLAGTGTATLQGASHTMGSVAVSDDLNGIGIVSTEGPTADNGAAAIPVGSSLLMNTKLEDRQLETYSFLMDIRVPNYRLSYTALYQNDLSNSKDASLFINKNGQIGKGIADLGYNGTFTQNWHRIVFVVKESKAWLYLDGTQIGHSSTDNAYNWLMSTGALFFGDENGEEQLVNVAEMRFWDKALSKGQVAGLGGVSTIGDPTEVTIPDPLGVWTFDNPDDLYAGSGTATLTEMVHATDGTGGVRFLPDGHMVTFVEGPAEGNSAVSVPVGTSMYMATNLNVSEMKSYSVLWDVKGSNLEKYTALLQNDLTNKKDGSLFFFQNKVGLNGTHGLGYNGSVENGKWYRILFVVENGYGTVYVNGQQVGQSKQPCDEHWKLSNAALFFADNSGEETVVQTAEIRFWNISLDAKQAAKLGAAGAGD